MWVTVKVQSMNSEADELAEFRRNFKMEALLQIEFEKQDRLKID